MPDAWRAHDLLALTGAADAWLPATAPGWVGAALALAPWVVVRRTACADGRIAVGVRGAERAHRYAARIGSGQIAAVVAPEQLLARQPEPDRRALPAMALLARLQAVFADLGLVGGPTGSVGFELASGVAVVRATSDLDLLLRPASPVTVPEARQLLAMLEEQAARCGCRVDVQVEGRMGAFALADYVQNRRVMLRTPHAAFLTDDPWIERLPRI